MNLAVVFTEYQLIQVQALVRHFNIDNMYLIIINNNRIKDWLIDHFLFREIIWYTDIKRERNKRIYKGYIIHNYNKVKKILESKHVEIMIGAQDENTIYSIMKNIADPEYYWSIEDGIANYYERDLKFKSGILFKNKLFKFIYGYDLKIRYRHGLSDAERIFRMAPEIANEKKYAEDLVHIIKNYLINKSEEITKNKDFLKGYEQFDQLVVTDMKHFSKCSVGKNSKTKDSTLYKFHPSDKVPKEIGVEYMDEKIPLEMVPFLLKNLKSIHFQVMSSSFLNLKRISTSIKITEKIERKKKVNRYLLCKYDKYFNNKI